MVLAHVVKDRTTVPKDTGLKTLLITDSKEQEGDDVVHGPEEEAESGAEAVGHEDGEPDRAHAHHREEGLKRVVSLYSLNFYNSARHLSLKMKKPFNLEAQQP